MILKAAKFAANAHQGQYRKNFNKRPYFYHVAAVAGRVAEFGTENEVVAAFLHDTLEDTSVTKEDLEKEFNAEVANLVQELTSYSKQINSKEKRAVRKKMDHDYLAKTSLSAKKIKLIDRACNLEDFLSLPIDDFSVKYAIETQDLLLAIHDADYELSSYVNLLVNQILKSR